MLLELTYLIEFINLFTAVWTASLFISHNYRSKRINLYIAGFTLPIIIDVLVRMPILKIQDIDMISKTDFISLFANACNMQAIAFINLKFLDFHQVLNPIFTESKLNLLRDVNFIMFSLTNIVYVCYKITLMNIIFLVYNIIGIVWTMSVVISGTAIGMLIAMAILKKRKKLMEMEVRGILKLRYFMFLFSLMDWIAICIFVYAEFYIDDFVVAMMYDQICAGVLGIHFAILCQVFNYLSAIMEKVSHSLKKGKGTKMKRRKAIDIEMDSESMKESGFRESSIREGSIVGSKKHREGSVKEATGGGSSWTGPTCCQSGYYCSAGSPPNIWYSQCVPGSAPPLAAIPTTTTTDSQQPTVLSTSSGCTSPVSAWGQCGGVGYFGSNCCVSGFQCVAIATPPTTTSLVVTVSTTVKVGTTTTSTKTTSTVAKTTTTAPTSTGTNAPLVLTDAIRNQILADHNYARRALATPVANNMYELLWDPILEQTAQNYLVKVGCSPSFVHNPSRTQDYINLGGKHGGGPYGVYVGENWYSGGPINSPAYPWEQLFGGATVAWTSGTCNGGSYNGVKYTCTSTQCSEASGFYGGTTGTCNQLNTDWGHFTQVMWANTQYVGCGYTPQCGTLCDYVEGGNFNMPANPKPSDIWGVGGAAASKCPASVPTNDNGLCK
ncbi:Peptidase inhibitor 16 [Boothiomyces sp. JEL0866]|nr:Peptidase inhibitor 16 [Boothiomyces sp. JEL0866]